MTKKYLVLSDAHIGLSDKVSDLLLTEKIIDLSKEYDKIIFNGDMLETWKFENIKWSIEGRAKKLQRIFDMFPTLREFMESDKCIVLIGNHDYVLDSHGFKDRSFTIDSPKGKIIITHGNDCNYSNSYARVSSKKSWLSITGAWFLSKISVVFKKVGFGCVDDHEKRWDKIIFTAAGGSKKLNEYVNKQLKEHDAYAMVTGHTHHAEFIELENGLHYNCGFCRHTEIQGVEIFEDGSLKLFNKKYNS